MACMCILQVLKHILKKLLCDMVEGGVRFDVLFQAKAN